VSITVYVVSGCPFCAELLADLRRRSVPHQCIDLRLAPERAADVIALTWDRRVPVVVDHERFTVGFGGRSSTLEELGIGASGHGG
jgi:glutaredoxin